MSQTIKVAELFAGVGGFRLGLEGYSNPKYPDFSLPASGNFKTVWANQWEPPGTDSKQFAARCYEARFGKDSLINEDISVALDLYENGKLEIPDVDMVVGGFPCQDYSVAKPLAKAGGLEGKKGVLWWEIYRFLKLKKPKYVLLENVDRLLKSPASQRGRDFAIMLSCFANLGYLVQWRIVNSAEYGFSQRRKRVYIYAELCNEDADLKDVLEGGILALAFPIKEIQDFFEFNINNEPYKITNSFNRNATKSPFCNAGAMSNYHVCTADTEENFNGQYSVLGDVLVPENEVPTSFYVDDEKLEKWRYLKGSKREKRVNKKTGFEYNYSEGAMAFPDLLTNPSRTILTGEGGSGASRFKHIIEVEGKYRRLIPDELDRLQGFPRGWTDTGMTDGQRAFCMGNALVVGIPHLIGKEIYNSICAKQ